METNGELGKKAKNPIIIQVDGGFQNKHLFAKRSPLTQPYTPFFVPVSFVSKKGNFVIPTIVNLFNKTGKHT